MKRITFKIRLWIFVFIAFGLASNAWSTIIYVDINASGSGTSWVDAYSSVQSALTIAGSGDTIVIAKGVYLPHASDRNVSFVLKQGVVLLGGFEGTELEFTQEILDNRDLDKNAVILSGDLNDDDVGFLYNSENSYHVLFSECLRSSIDQATIIDGFIVSGGNANLNSSPYDNLRGGGIFLEANAPYTCSPTFRNLIIENNTAQIGAGISIVSLNSGSACNPYFENFIVRNNRTSEADDTQISSAAGISINSVDGVSSPVFVNGQILRNEVVENTFAGTGGGIDISASYFTVGGECSPTFSDVLFCSNLASGGGAQIHTFAQGASTVSPVFTNITLAGYSNNYPIYNRNSGVYNSINMPIFINTLVNTSFSSSVYNSPSPSMLGPSPTFSYSNIRGAIYSDTWKTGYGNDGGNNMSEESIFFDTATCDVRLYENSPEISVGDGVNGDNIGYYQGSGLLYLDIEDATDFNSCSGDTLFSFQLAIKDESADSASYFINVGHGDMVEEFIEDTVINDTLRITINLTDNWFGKDTLFIFIENLVGESDTAQFEFSLNKNPVLTKYDLGVFNNTDSTFSVVLEPDTSLIGEIYLLDGEPSVNNYFGGVKPGAHFGIIEFNGCYSDTLPIVLPEYINDIPLEIDYFEESSKISLCHGDTTIRIEFKFVDDNIEQVDWMFNYFYDKIIPDSNFTLIDTDSSHIFEVIIPDTVGYYQLYIHAENIFFELANIYYEIYIVEPPVIDSAVIHDYGYDTCVYPVLSNTIYYYSLSVFVDDIDVTYTNEACGLSAGEHIITAYHDECPAEPYIFNIEAFVDTTDNGETAVDFSIYDKVQIYPVPADNKLSIEGLEASSDIIIINSSGAREKVIYSAQPNEEIDISELNAGMYIAVIRSNDAIITRKFLVK